MRFLLLPCCMLWLGFVQAQIRLPKTFTCSANTTPARTLFAGNTALVSMEAMARSFMDVPEVIAYYKQLGYPFPFQKTADGLWWGTGKHEEQNYYIIIDPETLFVFSAIAPNPAPAGYASFCSWFISAIRAEKKRTGGKSFTLTNYQGKACSAM